MSSGPEHRGRCRLTLTIIVVHFSFRQIPSGDDQLRRAILFRWPLEIVCDRCSPHHGGKSANPSWLYSWARPRTVVVSQRPPAPGTTDTLTPLERAGTPVLRTWQRGAIHFRWTPDRIITQGFLDLNGCRSLPAWPTGEGACSRRVFAMLLSSPWVLHDTAGRIVISLAGFLLGVIACACWQSSSTVPGPWSCRPGRGLRRRTCSSAHAKPPAIRWIDPGRSRPLPLTA